MKETAKTKNVAKPVRERAKAAGKARYPAGRAFGRVQYFEERRSLSPTVLEHGLVVRAGEAKAKLTKSAPKKIAGIAGRYLAAYRAKRQQEVPFIESSNTPVWQPLGPSLIPRGQTYGTGGNDSPAVSGRCIGVMASPLVSGHLVVCSANGGLWGSFDGGANWQPLTDDLPTLSMGALAEAPGSPNVVYAGLGEGDTQSQLGVGLLRSRDGGNTWVLVPSDALSGFGIYDIAVDPSDPFHLWVGTTGRMFESRDGGDNWRVVQKLATWSISIHPQAPDEIYAATNIGLIRSINGGSNWELVSLPGLDSGFSLMRMEVSHAPSKPAVIYVTGALQDNLDDKKVEGHLWRKPTASGSFTRQKAPPLKDDSDLTQAWYDWCLGVAPDNPDEVYWGAVELYKGLRGANGFSWENISSRSSGDSIHPDQHHIAFDPNAPDVVYVCNDGGLFRSTDRGDTWESLNPGLNITEFEYIAQLESDDHWLIGGTQDNGTLAYRQGREWRQVARGDGGDCGTDDANGLCYHSYYGMWIERARTRGSAAFRWKDVSPRFNPKTYDALFYPPLEVSGALVAKAGETLFVSSNQGDSWVELSFGVDAGLASALAIAGDDTIIVGTKRGEVYRVDRGDSGWGAAFSTALASPRAANLSDFYLPGEAGGVIWASSSAFGGGHVFLSQDGGASWEDCTGNLPDIPANALVGDPDDPTRLFIATDHGVYETRDSGASWRDFSLGLPNVLIGDLIFHRRLRLLRAGTRSRGVWEAHV